jgi:hypothetical protein
MASIVERIEASAPRRVAAYGSPILSDWISASTRPARESSCRRAALSRASSVAASIAPARNAATASATRFGTLPFPLRPAIRPLTPGGFAAVREAIARAASAWTPASAESLLKKGSQASPSPSWSRSIWSEFASSGQLSAASD